MEILKSSSGFCHFDRGFLWKLQFDFMVEVGLKPKHVFLDVGCGALRGGRYFIAFLNCGSNLGFEKERGLISAGV
jgi:hypothetical protein